MRRVISKLALLTVAATPFGGACAMSSPENHSPSCRVVDGDKLPAASGGASSLCTAVERAIAQAAPGARFSAEVRVLSRSRLSATLTLEGRQLPDIRCDRLHPRHAHSQARLTMLVKRT